MQNRVFSFLQNLHFSKTEKIAAFVLLTACIVAGVSDYVLTRNKVSLDQMRFQTAAGEVVFDHRFHAGLPGDCADCHHNIAPGAGENPFEMRCTICHYDGGLDLQTDDPHPRAIGAHCFQCHTKLGGDLAECGVCHKRAGTAFRTRNRTPALFPDSVESK